MKFEILNMRISGGPACSAINCSNNKGKDRHLSFFRFPKEPERCKQWVINCRRSDLLNRDVKYLYNNCKICANHFELNQFMNWERRKLKWYAVPTLFDIPEYPQPAYGKRNVKKVLSSKELELAENHLNLFAETFIKEEPKDDDNGILSEGKDEKEIEFNEYMENKEGDEYENFNKKENGISVKPFDCVLIKEEIVEEDFDSAQHNIENQIKLESDALIKQEEEEAVECKAEGYIRRESECAAPDIIERIVITPAIVDYGSRVRHLTDDCVKHVQSADRDSYCETDESNVDTFIFNGVSRSKNEGTYICYYCHFKTRTRKKLKYHLVMHNRYYKGTVCPVCKYVAKRSNYLTKHMKIHYEKVHVCNLCPYRAVANSILRRHMKIHTGEKTFFCSVCNYGAYEKHHIKMHMMIHTGEKPYECSICSYKSTRVYNLKNHMRKHTGERPFICNFCDYRSSDRSALKAHIRSHTGEKPFECKMCNFKTSRLSTLYGHRMVHNGEKPYICDICSFKTTWKSTLKKHIRNHNPEKPYLCSHCAYSAKTVSLLNEHKKIHTGVKQHVCNICNYKTTKSSNLKRHSKIHAELNGLQFLTLS